ncbi:MAG: LacI family DNA-binding transcriptional regulator [Candidatus Velthaea sp.]
MAERSVVTLLDVARHAGVSLATASRVVNGSDRRVSVELRERVTASAEQLRYVRNAYAQALARSRTSIAGVIIHDIGHPYFAGIVRGIQRVAAEVGQIVLICNSNRDPEGEMAYVQLLHEHRAATIIMAASGYDDAEYVHRFESRLEDFVAGGGHAALIGRHLVDMPAVVPDNIGGMYDLTKYLVGIGHRKIAFIGGSGHFTVTQDRLAGAAQALLEAGIAMDERWILTGNMRRESGEAAIVEMEARGLEPTAVIAINDEMAIGALAALRRLGYRVPDDISLAGFDDIPICADLQPPLTTVRLDLEEIGERAMRLALKGHDVIERETIPTYLVVRASTGPPATKPRAR